MQYAVVPLRDATGQQVIGGDALAAIWQQFVAEGTTEQLFYSGGMHRVEEFLA